MLGRIAMIKAMLWKQWRETGIIFLGFLLLMIFASFGFLNSCQYRSLRETSFLYHFIWCGFALTLAADLFVGDKNQGMEEFSRALPCHRLKICAIKFLYGAMMQILFGLVLGVIGFVVYQMQISSGHIFYDALYHITSATIESKQLPPIIYIFSPYILVLSFYTLSCALSVLCNTILESLLVGFAFWLIFSSLTIVLHLGCSCFKFALARILCGSCLFSLLYLGRNSASKCSFNENCDCNARNSFGFSFDYTFHEYLV